MNYIWITTQFEGFHKYPDAPEEVAFLRNRHRHIFHVKVWIEIFHNERDIEFILFKQKIDTLIKNKDLNDYSCETIADYIHSKLSVIYRNRKIKIEVNEDNENGCEKEY